MTKSKGRSRKPSPARRGDQSPASRGPGLFPNLTRLVEEVVEAQRQFERLNADNQRLREQLRKQGQELAKAQQQAKDLKAECESLKQQVKLAEEQISRAPAEALVRMFSEMADERHNRLLRKLLTFDGEEPELLRDLVSYLRDHLKLVLDDEMDSVITLTEETLDRYDVQVAVTPPCQARVIGRGISLDGDPVLRTQVEPTEGETNGGD